MSETMPRLKEALEGRYRIEQEIGAGGMATVYLAEDVRHERRVALKVLRPELAAVVGADRFLHEIKTTANLQHPHILPLHDSGEVDGVVFYVMPYVEGESLRDRLMREHQLPMEDALRIADEVLDALDYAHRSGVIHRDIKPENILLHDGRALVADFGVALAVSAAEAGARMTETGMSLGTPSYMSPEQAMGERDVSPRSDVYAMGCVLYEMLLGEPPFTGPTAQSVLARIITEDPKPLGQQRQTVPPHVEAAILQALAKLPADRHKSAAAFAEALDDAALVAVRPHGPARGGSNAALSRHPAVLGSVAIAAASLAFAGWAFSRTETAVGSPSVRFEVRHPEDDRLMGEFQSLAVSPDGRTIAMTVRREGSTRVQIRRVDEFETRVLTGTVGATSITFTPDGNWLTFNRGTALYKVPVAGGTPTRVADVPWNLATASYFPDGSIMVGSASDLSLYRLAREGADLERVSTADSFRGELNHRRPQALPDGEHVLFHIRREDGYHASLLSLSSGEWTDLGLGVTSSTVYSAGHLVYAQANRVLAVPFDPGAGPVTGARVVIDSIGSPGDPVTIWALAASPEGTLAYAAGPGSSGDLELIRVGRDGSAASTDLPPGNYDQPRWSPSGDAIAAQGDGGTLELLRTGSGGVVRLAPPQAQLPVWDPTGRFVAFGDGATSLQLVRSDGSRPPERIHEEPVWPYSWSPDGNTIGIYRVDDTMGRDILLLTRQGDGWTASPFLVTRANERSPAISPDGRWIAYVSDESGQDEVYVSTFPSGSGEWLVSRAGGREPAWSGSGRELIYRRGSEIFAVPIGGGDRFEAGAPTSLFSIDAQMTDGPTGERDWDVTHDGQSFLFLQSPLDASPFTLRVVTNFPGRR